MQNSLAFSKALKRFARAIPLLADQLRTSLQVARHRSPAFEGAVERCLEGLTLHLAEEYHREDPFSIFPEHISSLVPDITGERLETLLVQYLLLERLFRLAFVDVLGENRLSCQVERTLQAWCVQGFDRAAFLVSLDEYYLPIEEEFDRCTACSERQRMLNAVCERFLNSFDPREAAQWSVIYTPQEIVDFMCQSVEEQLKREFGRTFSSPHTALLDPCAGVASFIINVIGRIERPALLYKYLHELFCIEIMLLPYLIATLNIEQAFFDRMGYYKPFPGIRYADALG